MVNTEEHKCMTGQTTGDKQTHQMENIKYSLNETFSLSIIRDDQVLHKLPRLTGD